MHILEEGKKMYMKLFSDNSRPGHINGQGTCDENDFINNPALPKLSDVQRTQCGGGTYDRKQIIEKQKVF